MCLLTGQVVLQTLYWRRILTALGESLLAARWRQDLPSLSPQAGSPPSSISFVIRQVWSFLTSGLSASSPSLSNLPGTQEQDGVQAELLPLQLLRQVQHLPQVSSVNNIEHVLPLVGHVAQIPRKIEVFSGLCYVYVFIQKINVGVKTKYTIMEVQLKGR